MLMLLGTTTVCCVGGGACSAPLPVLLLRRAAGGVSHGCPGGRLSPGGVDRSSLRAEAAAPHPVVRPTGARADHGAGAGASAYGGRMHPDEFEDTEVGDEDTPPDWFHGSHLPEDARRMGLTSHVPDGALLDFAGSLDGTKPLHRFTAWVMLRGLRPAGRLRRHAALVRRLLSRRASVSELARTHLNQRRLVDGLGASPVACAASGGGG